MLLDLVNRLEALCSPIDYLIHFYISPSTLQDTFTKLFRIKNL